MSADRLEQARAVCQLTAFIEALPPELQLVLQLHYLEDLTVAEMAQVMDVSAARVSDLVRQALALLMARNRMNQAGDGHPAA